MFDQRWTVSYDLRVILQFLERVVDGIGRGALPSALLLALLGCEVALARIL